MANPALIAALVRRRKLIIKIAVVVLVVLLLLPSLWLLLIGGLFSTLVAFLNPVSVNNQGEDVHFLALQAVSAEYQPENDLDVYIVKVIDLFHHDKIMESQPEVKDFIITYFLLELEREFEVTETDEDGVEVTRTEIEIYYMYKSFYEIVATVRAAPFNFGDGAISSIVHLSMSGIGNIGNPTDGNMPGTPGTGGAELIGRYPAPIAGAAITCGFGWRIHPITGKQDFHGALDLQGAWHAPISTIADGVVVTVNTSKSPYGNYILIKHTLPEETFWTMYAHLSSVNVSTGQSVSQGDTIGIEGGHPLLDPNPGYSTGHHLHFEIRTEKGNVNPADYIY